MFVHKLLKEQLFFGDAKSPTSRFFLKAGNSEGKSVANQMQATANDRR